MLCLKLYFSTPPLRATHWSRIREITDIFPDAKYGRGETIDGITAPDLSDKGIGVKYWIYLPDIDTDAPEVMFEFGGENAKGADMGALKKARDIYGWREGMSEDEVVALMKDDAKVEKAWKETGWILGKDGKFRFEIDPDWVDDTSAELLFDSMKNDVEKQGVATVQLSQLAKSKEVSIFNNYPELRGNKHKVSFIAGNGFGRVEGMSIMGDDTHLAGNIFIYIPIMRKWDDKLLEEIRQVIGHETQHIIEEYEGFARGGSDEEELARMIKEELASDEEYNKMSDVSKNEMYALAEKRYRRLQGEAEAREVAKRQDKPAAWRANNPPSWDGIAPEDLIVREQSDWVTSERKMQAAARQAEMDSMPITAEQTGGGYAAKVEGVTVGVAATRDKALEMAAKYYEDGEMIPPPSLEKGEDGKWETYENGELRVYDSKEEAIAEQGTPKPPEVKEAELLQACYIGKGKGKS